MTTTETGLLDQLIEGKPPPDGRFGPYGGRFAPEIMQTRSRDVWVRDLAGVDCCFEAVLEPDEVAADSQVRARGLVTQSTAANPVIEVLYPARFDGARSARRPLLKEVDAETILRAWSNR